MQSLQFLIPGKVWGIGRGLDAVLPFACYSYSFSCYFDQRGKLMKALSFDPNLLNAMHQIRISGV
jgi:hypothetical protein